ncbi:g2078 [Coccomyxa viridis]|uniref:L-ascorbate peroxidase n=1 Tax=Coccomyxa viridis TaxID=1274662 RepID=A0ABP1FPQ6_9CHLO
MFSAVRLLSRRAAQSQARLLAQAPATLRAFAAEASAAGAPKSGGGSSTPYVVGGLGLAGGAYAYFNGYMDGLFGKSSSEVKVAEKPDYEKVRKAIAELIDSEKAEDYDDGSFGPILVRLAWHSSGSYDKASGTGGSNGATMRFPAEKGIDANKGLNIAQDLLEPIKKQFPWISYSDLWTLAGAVAIEELGGPHIKWRPGRKDVDDETKCPPDGRLPDAAKGPPHLRDIFYRMGFNDQEIVALSGAHALGRCHRDRSGFEGPWNHSPTTFSTEYFRLLLEEKWIPRKWDGPKQYTDASTKELMMLPTDMALIWDKKFKPYVELYAKDQDRFFEDFSAAFSRLLELGVPFPESAPAT